MLFRGESGLRLEPVREVSHAARNRPLLYDLRYDRRDRAIEFLAVSNGSGEAAEDFSRKLVAQLSHAKNVDSEVLGSRPGYSVLAETAGDSGLAGGDLVQKSFTRSNCGGCHGCLRG